MINSHALAFASASEFCGKLPFVRNFRSEDNIFATSFAKPFAFASEFLRNAECAAFCLRFGGSNSLVISKARQNSHSHSQLYRCDRGALRDSCSQILNTPIPPTSENPRGGECIAKRIGYEKSAQSFLA